MRNANPDDAQWRRQPSDAVAAGADRAHPVPARRAGGGRDRTGLPGAGDDRLPILRVALELPHNGDQIGVASPNATLKTRDPLWGRQRAPTTKSQVLRAAAPPLCRST